MAVRSEAEVEMVFPTPQLARKALLALKPEEASPGDRSSARISVRGRTLRLEIGARDTPSLRAALNSLLRLITVVRDMMELEEG
jgi:KEOPS complex subunit Pcc1